LGFLQENGVKLGEKSHASLKDQLYISKEWETIFGREIIYSPAFGKRSPHLLPNQIAQDVESPPELNTVPNQRMSNFGSFPEAEPPFEWATKQWQPQGISVPPEESKGI